MVMTWAIFTNLELKDIPLIMLYFVVVEIITAVYQYFIWLQVRSYGGPWASGGVLQTFDPDKLDILVRYYIVVWGVLIPLPLIISIEYIWRI